MTRTTVHMEPVSTVALLLHQHGLLMKPIKMVTPKSVYSELMLLHKVYQIDYREYITEFSIKTDCERLRWEMFLHSRNY